MQVSLVPSDHVQAVWPMVAPFMEQAAEYTHGRYSADDILVTLTDYDHDLWIAFDNGVIQGVTVTATKEYPRKRCLELMFCAGDEGMEWKEPMLDILQKWAFDNHCDNVEASGRLGWAKIFKDDGYKPLWQMFELPVATEGLGG